jgi:hypothetical protein
MDGLVYRETRGGGSDRAIVAKRLKAALAGREYAEGEPGQNLAKSIDADPRCRVFVALPCKLASSAFALCCALRSNAPMGFGRDFGIASLTAVLG